MKTNNTQLKKIPRPTYIVCVCVFVSVCARARVDTPAENT